MNLREAKTLVRDRCARYEEICEDPYTVVELTCWVGTPGIAAPFVARGFAKRNPKDRPNPELGIEIAKGRAIAKIARQLIQQ